MMKQKYGDDANEVMLMMMMMMAHVTMIVFVLETGATAITNE